MAESKDKREAEDRLTPEQEVYANEGGTARYPKGYKYRGHDMNALLDRADGKTQPEKKQPE